MGRSLTVQLKADGLEYTIGINATTGRVSRTKICAQHTLMRWGAQAGAFETDAKFLVSDGRTYGMIDGSRVDHRGKTLFSAYPNRCNQLDFVTVLQRAGTWGQL